MKYSEVLKEREAQIEMKILKEKMMKEQEQELEMKNLRLMNGKDLAENEAYIKKKEEILKLNEFHKKQYNNKFKNVKLL
jgi:hypothetical protein